MHEPVSRLGDAPRTGRPARSATPERTRSVGLGNRLLAQSVAEAPERPPGRGLRADALVARLSSTRPAGAARAPSQDMSRVASGVRLLQRTPETVKTASGEFTVDKYSEVDSDKDNDTKKSCGVNIEITFTPPEWVKSNKIGFVQVMKCLKGDGTPLLFENEKPRATDAASGDEGWAVDRLAGKKWGYYGMADAGTGSGNLKLGSRTDKTTAVDAWMHDRISLGREAGKTAGCTAVTFAIDIEHGTYLGGMSWGYSVDASGKVTKRPLGEAAMGAAHKAAIKGWNRQADLEDVTKRNAPDQQKLPSPDVLGDFPFDPDAELRYA